MLPQAAAATAGGWVLTNRYHWKALGDITGAHRITGKPNGTRRVMQQICTYEHDFFPRND